MFQRVDAVEFESALHEQLAHDHLEGAVFGGVRTKNSESSQIIKAAVDNDVSIRLTVLMMFSSSFPYKKRAAST